MDFQPDWDALCVSREGRDLASRRRSRLPCRAGIVSESRAEKRVSRLMLSAPIGWSVGNDAVMICANSGIHGPIMVHESVPIASTLLGATRVAYFQSVTVNRVLSRRKRGFESLR